MVFTAVQLSALPPVKSPRYSIDVLREEAQMLVQKGILRPNQPIFALCEYLPAREWIEVERVLEENEFSLRDRMGDLLAQMQWYND
jgi:Domain of unknown function (DUF4327)